MTTYQVKDAGDPRRYFTQIPNIIDDMNMSVYAFRLYVHLKRVAGDAGTCWQSTRTLAAACHMALGSVKKAKEELEKLKLITVKIIPGEHGEFSSHEITITDIWDKNNTAFTTCSPDEQDRTVTRTGPYHHVNTSVSPRETKNNPIKNNPNKNEGAKAHPPKTSRAKDPRLEQEAIRVYRHEMSLHVPINWRDEVIAAVTDFDLWARILHDWSGLGWNKQNIKGLLDAYKSGGIVSKNGNSRHTMPAGPLGLVGPNGEIL